MKLSAITFIAALALASSGQAASWTIGNTKYDVDTLSHITAGPGTTETELILLNNDGGTTTRLNVFYTETSLQNPNVEFRAAKAGNNIRTLETVPDIAKRMEKEGEHYFAGVNADFFNTTYPYSAIGTTISNGTPANFGIGSGWYHIWFNKQGLPYITQNIEFSNVGTLTYPSGQQYSFRVNTERATDQLILYSTYYEGANLQPHHTSTNKYGTEVAVRPVDSKILYGNKSFQLEVIGNPVVGVGNMEIPLDGYVLSAHGAACKLLESLKPGDIVTTDIKFYADDVPATVKELLGGFPFLIKDGTRYSTPNYPEHLSAREPRSAVGFDANRTKLLMMVVDGRNAGGSAGVTQQELADLVINLGYTNAMNFDGGGSSTMYLSSLGIKNIPSTSSLDKDRPEGTPRTVVNALFAVATSPADNDVASIEIKEKKLHLSTGEQINITVYGYNQYGVMIDSNLSGYTISIPDEIGTVSGSQIIGKSGNYSGILRVRYGDASYSIPVYLNGGGTFVNGAVAEIEIDSQDTPAEYFNTLGIRVTNPQPGQILIKRIGSKVSKEIYQ